MTSFKRVLLSAAVVTLGASFAGGAWAAELKLKASHQWPGGKGDVRDEMVQIIKKEVEAANVGLDVQVYPGKSLFKPKQQWDAMVKGQLDISAFPLDYASGKHPAVQRDPDAGPGQEPRPRQAAERFGLHGRHQEDHRRCRSRCAFRRLAGRRLRLQEDLHPGSQGRRRPGAARGRPGLRADAGSAAGASINAMPSRRSTRRCRPASWTAPTPRRAASCPTASTSRSSA